MADKEYTNVVFNPNQVETVVFSFDEPKKGETNEKPWIRFAVKWNGKNASFFGDDGLTEMLREAKVHKGTVAKITKHVIKGQPKWYTVEVDGVVYDSSNGEATYLQDSSPNDDSAFDPKDYIYTALWTAREGILMAKAMKLLPQDAPDTLTEEHLKSSLISANIDINRNRATLRYGDAKQQAKVNGDDLPDGLDDVPAPTDAEFPF